MGLFDRVEAKLAATINGVFARAFKAEVQPVEIAAAMRKAMDDKAAIFDTNRAVVPNSFVIELSPNDHERLTSYADLLTEELTASAEEHIASQHYRAAGGISIAFDKLDTLETGVFRVRSSSERGAPTGRPGVSDHGRGPRRPGEIIETHRTGDDPAWRIPRNPAYPPEATAAAEGDIGMAGHAATAAAGAAAGTAAARDLWESARNDHPDLTDAERAAQRLADLSAWKDATSGRTGDGDEGRGEGDDGAAGDGGHEGHGERRGDGAAAGAGGDRREGHGGAEGYGEGRSYRGRTGSAGPDHDRSQHPGGAAARGGYSGGQHTQPPVVAPVAPVAPVEPPEMPEHMRPDPANRPWIDVAGDAYPLLGAITVIGRDPNAEITLDDGGISRRHCEIRVTHDGPHFVIGLRDLGSTNGTFVNGERVSTARLDNGDRITIGRVSFLLHTRRR